MEETEESGPGIALNATGAEAGCDYDWKPPAQRRPSRGSIGGGADRNRTPAYNPHLIAHGHRLPDILDYTLAQVRCFAATTAREDAARDARLLSLIAIGARGDSRHLDQTLDRLQNHAHLGSHR